jgi:hypothetical protein
MARSFQRKTLLLLLSVVLLVMPLRSMKASAGTSAPMELWLWSHGYITSASAVQQSEARIDQAVADGYTGIVFWDSSFSFMAASFWNAQNVSYLRQVVEYAESKGLKVTATVAPYGASQDALQNNPNWAESQRVVGTQFQVSADGTKLQQISDFAGLQNSGLENGQTSWFSMNDAGVSVDCTTSHTGSCSALIQNAPNNARLVQSFAVHPWRQYHVRFWYKSQGCGGCNPNIYVYDAQNTNIVRFNASFNANGGQNWTEIDYTINSQASTQLLMYLGIWGGNTGSLWLDDISAEETALIFLTRRSGTPIKMYNPQSPSIVYQEGTDFNYITDPQMANGRTPFTDLWHTPPTITLPSTTALKPGQVVALDSYAVTMLPDDQVAMCLTEQGTLDWLKSNAQAISAMLPADAGLMMQYDEIRQMNSCESCRAKGLTAGQLLAAHVQQATSLYQSVHPGPWLYVWSDMFDPFHNAKNNYYYVEGDLSESWTGLSSGVSIMNWNLGNLTNSLTWFSGLNPAQPIPHQQMIAGYYDSGNGALSAQTELAQAAGIPGITGLMYTTWQDDYSQMAQFAAAARAAWPYYAASLAASKGNITGVVTDTTGAAVIGATVSLSNGTLTWSTTTSGSGVFSFSNVPSGVYTLQITSFGYNTYSNTSVTVPTMSDTSGNGDATSPSDNVVNLTIPLTQPAVFPSIRVKSGGAAMTDEQGNQWQADTNYDAGSSAAPAGVSVTNTPTPSLYASQHYNNGNFSYNFAVPNGNYYLTLKFAELYDNGPKQRLFNIVVNGNMVDQNLDVFTAAGGQKRAYDFKLPIVVSNQLITIQFQSVLDNPMVNAIEIDAAGSGFALPSTLTGQVLNYEGQTVPEASITLANGTNTLTTTTDNSGNFSFWNLSAGSYTIQASGLGYAPSTVTTLSLPAGNTVASTVTLLQPPTPLPIRIKCGSQSLTDEAGNFWVSDRGLYDYGSIGATSNNIANTVTPSVYQSERWMSGPMTYRIPAPNGTYNLVLKFSELYWWAANQRVFSIVVNGVLVQKTLDVFAAAGGAYTAYDLTIPVSVTNQWLTVEFDPIVNNPKINAIELDPVQVGPSTVTGTIQNIAQQGIAGAVVWVTNHSYRRSTTSDASGRFTISNLPSGTYTVQATATGYIPYTAWSVQVNPAVSTTVNMSVIAADPSFSPLRLNAGGPALEDQFQQSWTPDGGYYWYGSVGASNADISNIANPEIYQLQRWMSGNLNYDFTLPNGNYMVILKFAETYFNSPGQRVFNVVLNGTTAVPNFDIFKAAGGANLAYDLQVPVTISNGSLNLQLQQIIQNPSLAAIDIEAILPEPVAAVSPQALTFGHQQLGLAGTPQSLTISNLGNAPLTVTALSVTGINPADFILQNGCGTTLAAHAQCTVQVTFQPIAVGARSAMLVLQSNVGPQSVALSGTGYGTPQAVLNTASLSFGTIGLGSSSPAQTVTVSNLQGTAALSIASISLAGPNASDFTLPNSCNSSIAAGAACSISVQFAPTALGTRQATLVIADNANPSPQIIVLTGIGGIPSQLLEISNQFSGKALDVSGRSLDDGALVQQWTYGNGQNQQWFLIDLGNGYYEIQNNLSHKALGVVNGSRAAGALIEQREYLATDYQQWLVLPLANGCYSFMNKASLQVLEVPNFSQSDGAQLDQWNFNTGLNQQWTLKPANY